LFTGFEDRPDGGDVAVLVHSAGAVGYYPSDDEELRELTRSAGVDIVGELNSARREPDPGTYLGSGKLDELRELREERGAEVVIFGTELSPSQERNVERVLRCRVVDRTRLILDIFAQRASSYEGKLQVELAQLQHMSTRLVRGWTHLERQKGGIGLRGPGEKQLETDRRLLNLRVKQIRQRLDGVRGRRALSRRSRERADVPVVSLVGYTNAGKSTLFNALTGSDVMAADMLFATLDPTLRRLKLPTGLQAVLGDTVGFVRHLPHELVAAFEATLEESRQAELLLHVVDAADPDRAEKGAEVDSVLARIDASKVPKLVVYNKIDALPEAVPRVDRDADGLAQRVWVSALTGAGMQTLAEVIEERLAGRVGTFNVRLPWSAGAIRARIYRHLEVVDESVNAEAGWELQVRCQPQRLEGVLRDLEGAEIVTITPLYADGGAATVENSEDTALSSSVPSAKLAQ
jgi:GTPase